MSIYMCVCVCIYVYSRLIRLIRLVTSVRSVSRMSRVSRLIHTHTHTHTHTDTHTHTHTHRGVHFLHVPSPLLRHEHALGALSSGVRGDNNSEKKVSIKTHVPHLN
jgi:hypothetical protein